MIPRARILGEAYTWLGTPFAHQGDLKGIGCDCIGLLSGVARNCGVEDAERWQLDRRRYQYGPMPFPSMLRAAVSEYLDPLPLMDALAGDVLLMTFFREPMHFAIITEREPMRMIHGYQPVGRVVENSVDAKWHKRIIGTFRMRGVE